MIRYDELLKIMVVYSDSWCFGRLVTQPSWRIEIEYRCV